MTLAQRTYTHPDTLSLFAQFFAKILKNKSAAFVCLGTDANIGDALGPMIGTKLLEKEPSLHVYGTLKYPIDGANYYERIKSIKQMHNDSLIIAVDSALAPVSDTVGHLLLRKGPLDPGGGVGKNYTMIGDYTFQGIVGETTNPYQYPLGNVRLHIMMEMAEAMTNCILKGYRDSVGGGEV